MPKSTFLPASLDQLVAITEQTHNEQILPVALSVWRKHLQDANPVWRFLNTRAFAESGPAGSAHVIAMIDKRLPELGLVGFFGCTNAETGVKVLTQAADWLKGHGIENVYGPINGTITRDYRFNLCDDYLIPGEPVNPSWYIDVFRQAGFEVFNRYVSGISNHYRPFVKIFIRKPTREYHHLVTRSFNVEQQLDDLKTYHGLMNEIFPHNSIYCPVLSWEERAYNVISGDPIFDPAYTYFLEDNGRAIGFIVAFPYGERLIIKTIGVLPGYRGMRVSGLLIHKVHDQAAKDGLKAAIYSTIRVGNSVYKMKRPGVKVYRQYVTMKKSLELI